MTRRRSSLAVAALATGSLTFLAAPAHALPADRDCSDFSSQAAAQSYFESRGPGDPDRLDANNDGRACENLPGPSAPAKPQPTQREQPAKAQGSTQRQQPAKAQGSTQRQQPAKAQGSTQQRAAATPQGGVAAGGGGTADPSSQSLPAAGALLGVLLMGAGVVAARRRPTTD